MGTENSIDLYRTEPGTLAGRYLRSFWQPVYRAKDLAAGEAVPLRIMSDLLAIHFGEGPVFLALRDALGLLDSATASDPRPTQVDR